MKPEHMDLYDPEPDDDRPTRAEAERDQRICQKIPLTPEQAAFTDRLFEEAFPGFLAARDRERARRTT